MARKFGNDLAFPCDVSSDAKIRQFFVDLTRHRMDIDGFVHAIASALREAPDGEFFDGFWCEAFRIAHDVSAHSFPALTKAALVHLNAKPVLLT